MSKLQTIEQNPEGLHARYQITKSNGEPVDPDAVYFVLRLDSGGDDKAHIDASRHAVNAYCLSIFSDCHALDAGSKHLESTAHELVELLRELKREPFKNG